MRGQSFRPPRLRCELSVLCASEGVKKPHAAPAWFDRSARIDGELRPGGLLLRDCVTPCRPAAGRGGLRLETHRSCLHASALQQARQGATDARVGFLHTLSAVNVLTLALQ